MVLFCTVYKRSKTVQLYECYSRGVKTGQYNCTYTCPKDDLPTGFDSSVHMAAFVLGEYPKQVSQCQ